jgi:hypothetical protein
VTSAIKRAIFLDFPRASWQYDIIVIAILAFIFLTPRDVFRDQPKAPSIVLLPNDTAGVEVFHIEPKLLVNVSEGERYQKAAQMLERRDGKKLQLYRLEPIFDSEKEIKGFMAYTKVVR